MISTEFRRYWSRLLRSGTGVKEPISLRPIVGPDFVCIGMQKSGTQWLFDQMNARRDVWMPPIKEFDFFIKGGMTWASRKILTQGRGSLPIWQHSDNENRHDLFLEQFSTYDMTTSDIDWYRGLFDLKGEQKSGDISPNYCKMQQHDIAYFAKCLPTTRIIFLLRNPVDRIWSALCMYARRNKITAEQLSDWGEILKFYNHRFSIKDVSFPSKLWNKWSGEIPKDRIRYWFFDDIVERPQVVLDEICEYLQIEPGPGKLPANFNEKEDYIKVNMPSEIRIRLTEFFTEEYEDCAAMFGGHALNWLEQANLTK